MKCAVIPINRSDFTFESSVASIMRTLEIFDPDVFFILYAKFNEVMLKEKLKDYLEKIKNEKGKKVETIDITTKQFDDLIKLFEDILKGKDEKCDQLIMVPTSGANIVATAMGVFYSEHKDKVILANYIFAFGPWSKLYYPFVPRNTEKVILKGNLQSLNNKSLSNKFSLNMSDILNKENNKFVKDIMRISYELNTKYEGDDANLKVKCTSIVDSKEVVFTLNDLQNLPRLLNKLVDMRGIQVHFMKKEDEPEKETKRKACDFMEKLLRLLGFYKVEVETENERIELSKFIEGKEKVVIDTNLIYYGIHSYEVKGLTIPFCIGYEIEKKRFEAEGVEGGFADLLVDIYNYVLERSRVIPTEITFCDPVIPRIDPHLMENSVVLSGDKKAVSYWKTLPLNKYTKIYLVEPKKEYRGKDQLAVGNYLMLELGIALDRIFKYGIEQKQGSNVIKTEVCWDIKDNVCVTL